MSFRSNTYLRLAKRKAERLPQPPAKDSKPHPSLPFKASSLRDIRGGQNG